VAGQLPDDLDTMLRDSLGAWAAPEPSPSAPEHTPTLDAPDAPGEVWLIDRPEAVQAVITIGTLTPTRRDAAWSPAQVGVCALGGSFGSRLNSVLREERGFTYGAGCGLSAARDRGVFSTRTSCRVEVAAEAASVTLRLLDVSATPFTEAEAADAVAYLVGVAPLNYDTADAVAAQAVALAEAGMPMSWIDEHNDLIRATTATAATEALAPWIEPQRLRTVVCGPAAALLGPLRAAGLDARVVDVAGNPL
jgi:predicted Zn-dependent peptidase